MKPVSTLIAAVLAAVLGASLQAHEGHAAVGTMVHDLEHAGWIAGALMLGSVLMLVVFSLSVRFADKQMSDKNRRD